MVHLSVIDLAWIPGGQSGWCVIEASKNGTVEVVESGVRSWSPERLRGELVDRCAEVVGIDGPLAVGPGRFSDRDLGRWFARYAAAPFLATERFLGLRLRAGPELAAELVGAGYSLDPMAAGRGPVALEVYPHALHVTWFRLGERLRYKRKRGRTVASVREALFRLQSLLAVTAGAYGVKATAAGCLAADAGGLRGRALKALEDELDGLTCALAAFLAWRDGLVEGELFGAPPSFIAVPGRRSDPDFVERFTSVPVPPFPSAQARAQGRSARRAPGAAGHA